MVLTCKLSLKYTLLPKRDFFIKSAKAEIPEILLDSKSLTPSSTLTCSPLIMELKHSNKRGSFSTEIGNWRF